MSDLTRLTAAETAAAVASGQTSAVEVTEAHLARIEAVDEAVHAFLHVDTDGARDAARRVDARRGAGEELGPLAGVPLALKDVIVTEGVPDHVRVADARGLAAAVRRHRGPSPPRGGRGAARQDEHGRVRHGQLDRALGVRADPQPVGPGPHPRRLGRRLGGGGGRLRGTARRRHRHRRLDPPAGRGHRHGRGEADVRRRVAATGWWRSPRRSTRRARARAPCSTRRCCTPPSPATTRWTRPRSTPRCPTWWRPRGCRTWRACGSAS